VASVYEDDVKETVKSLRRCGSGMFRKELVEALMQEHRQHQGDIFAFVGELIHAFAGQEYFDARNEVAVLRSREILEKVERV
jgi:hypothetical protein